MYSFAGCQQFLQFRVIWEDPNDFVTVDYDLVAPDQVVDDSVECLILNLARQTPPKRHLCEVCLGLMYRALNHQDRP